MSNLGIPLMSRLKKYYGRVYDRDRLKRTYARWIHRTGGTVSPFVKGRHDGTKGVYETTGVDLHMWFQFVLTIHIPYGDINHYKFISKTCEHPQERESDSSYLCVCISTHKNLSIRKKVFVYCLWTKDSFGKKNFSENM